MTGLRKIEKIIAGRDAKDGAGVKLVRVFGKAEAQDFDPFLMLDAFDSVDPEDYIKGFPWHPHRGIETITYLIHGDIEHSDSMGNRDTILSGDCQWMTAGSGIIHQETPRASRRLQGVQLWLNMPAANKMSPPGYRSIRRKEIPVVNDGDTAVHILAGKYKEVSGAAEGSHVKPLFFDVEMKPGSEWSLETEPDQTLFLYILEGSGYFKPDREAVSEKHAVLFHEGKWFWVKAADQGIRFLLLAAKPLKESVAWGGPVVMNTDEELKQAFEELNSNTFVK